jgi:ketosteroid isomerase-like protein
MQMKRFLFAVSFLLPVHFICAQQDKYAQVATIKSYREASNASIARHDIEGIAKYWLPDFVQVRGNASFMVGKDSIINSWTALFKSNREVIYIRNPSEIIISTNDTLAWEKGTWTAKKSYSNGGNYSAMWRKVNGVWRLQAELFVSLH